MIAAQRRGRCYTGLAWRQDRRRPPPAGRLGGPIALDPGQQLLLDLLVALPEPLELLLSLAVLLAQRGKGRIPLDEIAHRRLVFGKPIQQVADGFRPP